tara:strand:+ start:1308 stop:1688 length:381 start_codon:yes stop_codon:yes gene_type:complete
MQVIKIGPTKLKIKQAKTTKQQKQGLMNVKHLPEDQGMLFSYPVEKILTFWMKSTVIPLSIAFIDKNKKIIEIKNLKPNDESLIKSSLPAKWALEVNQGWFEKNNVKENDKIVFLPSKKINLKITI